MSRPCVMCGFENEGLGSECELCGVILDPPASRPAPHPSSRRVIRKPPITDLAITGEALRRSTSDLPVVPSTSEREEPPQAHPQAHLRGRLKLVVEQGKIIGEQYLLSEQRMWIGRIDPDGAFFPEIDLSAQDPDYVHRRHARLQFHDLATRLSVEHMGGRNHTLVNNKPIVTGELMELCVGDSLRIGRVVMRLVQV